MIRYPLIAFLLLAAPLCQAAELALDRIAIVYNTSLPESEKLARHYAQQRGIEEKQLVGLELPDKEQISRKEFDALLREPLIEEFDRRQWWLRKPLPDGKKQLAATKVRVVVCMRGVPSRIYHADTKGPEPAQVAKSDPQAGLRRMMNTASASVDSELTLLGIPDTLPRGPLDNPYFKSITPIATAEVPILLVGRIDGPSFDVCRRMIDDAVAVEKTGLWGFAVVDIANKSDPRDPNGDPWFQNVVKDIHSRGIPVMTDRFDQTLPNGFPLPPTALYYGWYAGNVNGPFVTKGFRFKRGAIAVHLHSFSAAQLRQPGKNWCAPLLARGAAATLGNTFEPFLHLTHHLDVFNDRLLRGHTLVEAAYMAMPVVSWQGVVIGDPLYRPFAHLDGSGVKQDTDRVFRALRIARMRWQDDDRARHEALKDAAERMQSGQMMEALALDHAESLAPDIAGTLLRRAGELYRDRSDQLRTELLTVKLDRERGLRAAALQGLRTAIVRYPDLPGKQAAEQWLKVLEPPPASAKARK